MATVTDVRVESTRKISVAIFTPEHQRLHRFSLKRDIACLICQLSSPVKKEIILLS